MIISPIKSHAGLMLKVFLFAFILFSVVTSASAQTTFPDNPIRLTIMHTNDFHSHLTGLGPDAMFTPKTGDGDPVLGHAARLMTAIQSVKSHRMRNAHGTLLVDAGDSMFGTLFHMLSPNPESKWVPEYRFYHEAGYDAIGLGNHDFDADEKGLAIALKKAQQAGYHIPFVATNLRFTNKQSPLKGFYYPGGKAPEKAGIQDFQIKSIPGGADQPPVRVGILGLVGPDAAQLCATTRKNLEFVGYNDRNSKADARAFHDYVQKRVDELRSRHNCNIVVALLHGGAPEDEELAKAVYGIDVLICGHTHQAYVKRIGKTILAQSGHGGANLGVLDLEFNCNGVKLLNENNPRILINDDIPANPGVLAWLRQAKAEVNRLIQPSGFKMNQQVCTVTKERRRALFPNNHAQVYTASRLFSAVNRRLVKPIDLYLSTNGLIRSEYMPIDGRPTHYTFSDVFKFSSLGFATDGSPGAPVVVFTLSRIETKMLFEILTWLAEKSPVYAPVVSDNVKYSLNKKGIPLASKISDLKMNGKPLLQWPKRVRIASSEFFARNLFKIRNFTKGVLRITPRDEAGNPITTFADSGLPREHILLADELLRISIGEVTDPSAQP